MVPGGSAVASIYKRKQDKSNRRSAWYIGFTDHNGKRRTVKGYTDKAASEQLAVALEEEARQIKSGLKPAPVMASKEPIETSIRLFRLQLEQKEITGKRVSEVASKLQRVAAACQWLNFKQVSEADVERQLGLFRTEGMSKQTSNHYLRAMKQFSAWLVKSHRLRIDPLADLKMLNANTDRRHLRRALTPEELTRLVEAAEYGKSVEEISGPDRAMMYLIAAWTGYRKGEIGSLRLPSFDLKNDPATVIVEAQYSKHRRQDIQVLHPDLAQRVRDWLADRNFETNDLLFPVSAASGGTERKTALMMRVDLEAARKVWLDEAADADDRAEREKSDVLAYKDHRGRFADFHANRHTFITNLGRAGVNAKTVQTLARHSDIRLTMNTYSHTELVEKQAAIEQLSVLLQRSGSAPAAQNGTGLHNLARSRERSSRSPKGGDTPEEVAASGLGTDCHSLTPENKSAPGGVRTPNPRFRRPMLYPIELRMQCGHLAEFIGGSSTCWRSMKPVRRFFKPPAMSPSVFNMSPETSRNFRSRRGVYLAHHSQY